MKKKSLSKVINIKLIITIIFIIIFAIYYSKFLNYGLPYFSNADEIAHLKSVLYYFGFFSSANQNIVEPIFAPFLNFIISGTLIFINNLIFLKLPIPALEGFIFLNPDKLVFFLRMASLVTSCFSFFILFLIIKKLKINILFYVLMIVSIFFSPFIYDTSLVAGKNSSLTLFFLLQFYLFIKYYLKINNFNLKSYILFSILASLSWGINYWCATPSIYAIGLLHYNKFKFTKLKFLFLFLLIFFLGGILPNLLLIPDNPLIHLFSDTIIKDNTYYNNSENLNIFFQDMKSAFFVFFNFEKFLVFAFIFAFTLIKYLTKIEKGLVFSIFFLSIEPAILFAVADYSYPQLRYFGPSIVLMHFLVFLILDRTLKSGEFKFNLLLPSLIIIIFLLMMTIYSKIQITDKYLNVINKNYNQYEALNYLKKNDMENKTLIITPAFYRESIKNLDFYEFLLSEKLVLLNPEADNKNSTEQINIKRDKIKKFSNIQIYPNSKEFVFFGGEYLIANDYIFINELSKKFEYILIHDGYVELVQILKKNHILHKSFESDGPEIARAYLANIHSTKYKGVKKIGPTLNIFELK